MSVTLRPLALGELLDKAIAFWRGHWRPLFILGLGFQLLQYACVAAGQAVSRAAFPLARDGAMLQRAPLAALPHLSGMVLVLLASGLAALAIAQVLAVALSHAIWQGWTGQPLPSVSSSVSHAVGRLGAMAGAFALALLASVLLLPFLLLPAAALAGLAWLQFKGGHETGAIVLAVLGGLAALLALAVLVLWFVVRFLLLPQAVALEDATAWGAFKRSGALASGRIGPGLLGRLEVRLTVLLTVIGAILVVASALAALPLLAVGLACGASFAPGRGLEDVVPLGLLVPLQLLQTVLGAVVNPLYVVFQVAFYADVRARREGLDLAVRLASAAP